MRILFFITRSDAIGGAQIHVRDLCLALKEEGHEVSVLTGSSGVFISALEEVEISVIKISHLQRSISLRKDIQAFVEIFQKIKVLKPDIISTHSVKAGFIGRLIGFVLRRPVLFTAHGWSHIRAARGLTQYFYKITEYWLAKIRRMQVIVVSEQDRQYAISDLNIKDSKIHCIANGMPDILNASIVTEKKHAQSVKLLMIARFEKPKDFHTLCTALASLKFLPWEIGFVGDGPDLEEIKKLTKTLEIFERCTFHGYLTNVIPLLNRADVYVLSSKTEGMPRSIIEAMRSGLPVIATDVGGVSELIDEKNGFLTHRSDPNHLAEALRILITNTELRQQQGQHSREKYVKYFHFERMFEKTYTLYQNILSKKEWV